MLDVVGRRNRFGDDGVRCIEHAEVEVRQLAKCVRVDVVDDAVAVAFDDDPVPDERRGEKRAGRRGLIERIRVHRRQIPRRYHRLVPADAGHQAGRGSCRPARLMIARVASR